MQFESGSSSRKAQSRLQDKVSPSATLSEAYSTPLRLKDSRDRTIIDDSMFLDDRSSVSEEVVEAVSSPLLPPIPIHFTPATTLFYRYLSGFLSTLFLVVVILLGALIKSLPTLCWTIWSWCQFKDPGRFRPFYEEEKERRHLETGKLKCDIGYYAQRVGLECDETTIETEDGFILVMHHIVDRRPGAVDSKRITCLNFRC